MLKKLKAFIRRTTASVVPPELRKRTPITLYDIARRLPHRPVIVEAGAHNGCSTVELARLKPGAFVHAFEPVPRLFQELTRRASHLPNVRCYELALSERTTQATMYISGGGGDASSSLLPPKEHLLIDPHILFEEQQTVSSTTLEEWAKANGVDRVDFFWLDMQGGELAALKGGEELLRSSSLIYSEVNLIENYAGGPLYHEVRSWLGRRGFSVAQVDFPNQSQGEVLFVRDGATTQ
jgi:FkbM family methyltransferase